MHSKHAEEKQRLARRQGAVVYNLVRHLLLDLARVVQW